ncbi:MAG: chemotaxis protein CheR [Deltaproteobacteria bacterium]|nr:chemotaxis protein CheR [Deltaproteobacteria bacterium]
MGRNEQMQRKDFDRLRYIIYEACGISLSKDKIPLVVNRISKRQRALGIKSQQEYLRIIEEEKDPEEFVKFIDAISTNTTYFYREKQHFELLTELFKKDSSKGREIKLWCAAASSGEEPYTLAMTACESLNLRRTPFRMLATDICTKVLDRAVMGRYTEKQVENIPKLLRQKYFDREATGKEKYFQATAQLRELILFKRLNLSKFPYPVRGPFDYIFCRNVMIYFDAPLREKVINAFYSLLRRGGYLFIGHSENLLGLQHSFKGVQASVFRKD